MKSPQIQFRRPPYILHAEHTSHSGKYFIYLGHHYHESAKECWVVGAYNIITADKTERHYNQMEKDKQGNTICKDPKADALIFWETFSTKMLERPDYEEETDEWYKVIKPYLEREATKQGIGKKLDEFIG